MEKPLISVIIPTYNRKNLLKEAVETVENQSWKNLEILVLDDGSDDGTQHLSFPDNVRYVPLEHCGMPGKVRNTGVVKSQGDWVAFLDSDDLWEPQKLELQMASLQASGLKWGHCRERWLRDKKVVSQAKFLHQRQGNLFKDALQKCIIGPSTVLMKKDFFQENQGFAEDLEVAEDYEFWLRLCALEPIDYLDQELVIKRAGRWEQLSRKHGHIEDFRLEGLYRFLLPQAVKGRQKRRKDITDEQRHMALGVFQQKLRIYLQGAAKRGNIYQYDFWKKRGEEVLVSLGR